MKGLSVLIAVMLLSGCADARLFPKGYFPQKESGTELAYKCEMDPYNFDCLHPPAVLKSQ